MMMRAYSFTLLTVLILIIATPLAKAETVPHEIVVTAEASRQVAPNYALITALVETTGATAKEAATASAAIIAKISAALTTGQPNTSSLIIRDEKFSGATAGSPIAKNGVVRLRTYIGVELADRNAIASVIDSVLQLGAQEISAVELSARDSQHAAQLAIEEATKKAAEKAATLAANLGVKLGPVVEATVTEDPAGKITRLQQMQGQTLALNDRSLQVYVNVRFQILK